MESELYQQVIRLIDEKKLECAQQKLEKLIESNPQNADLFYTYGNIYSKKDQYIKAKQMYEQCLLLNSCHFKCLFNYANLLSDNHELRQAQLYYKKAITLQPKDLTLWNNLGLTYLDTHQYDQAEMAFKQCLKIDCYYSKAYCNLGLLHYRLKWYRKAQKYLKKAEFYQWDNYIACYNLSLVLKQLGRHNQALKKFFDYVFYSKKQQQSFREYVSQMPYDQQDIQVRSFIAEEFHTFASQSMFDLEYPINFTQQKANQVTDIMIKFEKQ